MNDRFASTVILVTAASWAGFAIWLWTHPNALLPAFGVQQSTPAMVTEVRAFYGGVEAAIAVAMLVLWKRDERSAALIVGGLPLLGSALGRLSGLFLDGYSSLHLSFAGLEVLGFIFCLAAMMSVSATHSSTDRISDQRSDSSPSADS